MAADLIFFIYAYKLTHITSLSCKKLKIIFTLKRGDKGQFLCIQKNIKSAAIFEQDILVKETCPSRKLALQGIARRD